VKETKMESDLDSESTHSEVFFTWRWQRYSL